MSKKRGKPPRKAPRRPTRTAPSRPIDCEDAIEQLYSYLDGELTARDESAVRGHLDDCSGCFGQYEFERAFLRFLEARCRAQAAPEPLRRRIFEQILLNRGTEGR